MKKVINLSFFLILFGFVLLACSSSSDDYEPPRDEEELSIQQQMSVDSTSVIEKG